MKQPNRPSTETNSPTAFLELNRPHKGKRKVQTSGACPLVLRVSELLGPVEGLEALGERDHRAARRLGARLLAAREGDAW